jgi:Ca-activated chloride channel family protein
MLAVDFSSSMMGLDFHEGHERKITTRLNIAIQVTNEFIQNRANDRIGMCAFAGGAYLVSPVTMNHEWLHNNLKHLHLGLVEDRVAIGNAIAMCVNGLKKPEAKTKLVVLLTDGSNTAGNIAPLIATETAAAFGIKIHTIGIGNKGILRFAYPEARGNSITDLFARSSRSRARLTLTKRDWKPSSKKRRDDFSAPRIKTN